MTRMLSLLTSTVCMALLFAGLLPAQEQFGPTVDKVNPKLVKLFGTGGVKGLAHYGTGIVISPDGYVLTIASHILDTGDLRAHLYDGRRVGNIKTVVVEPVLDLAILKMEGVKDLPHYNIAESAKRPMAELGDWVLAFSNQFEIATRDEPMTVQKGVIAGITKLQARRGAFEVPYTGDVYVVDAITNNPGAAGGALTTRKGELLGVVGKELKNTQTDTWINYAIPLHAKVEVQLEDKKQTVSLLDFVSKGMKGDWQRLEVKVIKGGQKGETGIRLVQDVVDRTPPYVEEVLANSSAAKAGVRPDDLIVYINGEQVISVKAYNDIMSKISPGSKIVVEVRRGDKLQSIELDVKEPVAKKR